jgi:hypothetical protein
LESSLYFFLRMRLAHQNLLSRLVSRVAIVRPLWTNGIKIGLQAGLQRKHPPRVKQIGKMPSKSLPALRKRRCMTAAENLRQTIGHLKGDAANHLPHEIGDF